MSIDIKDPADKTAYLALQLQKALRAQTIDVAEDGFGNQLATLPDGSLQLIGAARVNAQDYGVRANNTPQQNQASMAKAIAAIAVKPRGGDIFLPAGEYQFDGDYPVSFPKVNGRYYRLVGENGATIKVGAHATTAPFYVGSAASGGAANFVCENIRFRGASSIDGICFDLQWANGARFEGCSFILCKTAANLTSSYGVIFDRCTFDNVGGPNIYSSTHCHHLIIDKCGIFSAGVAAAAQFIFIAAGHTDNIVIRDSDFEQCRQVLKAVDGVSSLLVDGGYIEFCATDPFDFGTGAYSTTIFPRWLAFGPAITFQKWMSGTFVHGRLYDQAVTFGTDCGDVDVFDLTLSGTSTLDVSALRKLITGFVNAATADVTTPPAYQKVNGVVYLSGKLNTLPGGALPVFTLPAGYRPQESGEWSCASGVASTPTSARLGASGTLVPGGAAGTSIWLNGISFKVAN